MDLSTAIEERATVWCRCGVVYSEAHRHTCVLYRDMREPIVLSDDEARELCVYLRHQYLDPNRWRSLSAFYDRVARALGEAR